MKLKKYALFALLLPVLAQAAGRDVYIQQRFVDNTRTETKTVVPPPLGIPGLMGISVTTGFPEFVTIGSGLSYSGGQLSSVVAQGPAGPGGPQGPQGQNSTIPGPPGQDGINGTNGSNGISPVLSIGSVSTGSSSSASLTGTASAPLLNLVLQKGDTGATGAASTVPGPTGPTGPTGPASTVPGPAGLNGANGTNGTNGVSPALSIGTVTSGAAPAATFTGTQAAPVLNLVLQKGDTGAASTVPGPTGATGATGATGPALALTTGPVTRPLNTAFQISATRGAFVSYGVNVNVSAVLIAGSQGTATIQYADNAAMTVNLVNAFPATSLIGGVLNVSAIQTVTLSAYIPAGKYVRITTAVVAGAPTFAWFGGNETLN